MSDTSTASTYTFVAMPNDIEKQFYGFCKDTYGYPLDEEPLKLNKFNNGTQLRLCYEKCVQKHFPFILVYHRGDYKNKC